MFGLRNVTRKRTKTITQCTICAKLFTDAKLKYLHNIKHCGMRILDIQNLQFSHNNFYISINGLNLENETSINLYFNFSYKVLQQATHNIELAHLLIKT